MGPQVRQYVSTEFCEYCERNGNNDIPKFLWDLVGPITDCKADVKQTISVVRDTFGKMRMTTRRRQYHQTKLKRERKTNQTSRA
jgi:hypothetical protein